MKKYYWLKLKNNFFSQREIKKIRKIPGGDTYVIIYLKLQLHSLENVGQILYAETEENICEQLSYDLDEDIKNIQITLKILEMNKLIEKHENQDISMIETKELIGTESESASRVRKHRNKKKALQCNQAVTGSNKLVTTETEQYKQIEKRKKQRHKHIKKQRVTEQAYFQLLQTLMKLK
ncbi:phage replisome organizer N-terminal domain-containing protein [Francisella salimarina]|uniref:phage replisome organizer N-terminal domain-containing protein n=1 Tax=Francisella salimarina TaxID=2599927 RepID=UPI003D81A471